MSARGQLNVRTARWRAALLSRASALTGRSVSEIIREAIDEKLSRLGIRPSDQSRPQILSIEVLLYGDEAARFLAFERREFLTAHPEAGRKLLLSALEVNEALPPRKSMARSSPRRESLITDSEFEKKIA